MPILENAKRSAEQVTGLARPSRRQLSGLVVVRRPSAYRFADDGETPNNPRFPFLYYRDAVKLTAEFDPAAIFEELFAAHGWTGSWRDSVYGFLHFHTRTHEVLGIARGNACVRFGGRKGRALEVRAGDVAVLPAGTGHCRISASKNLLVVGAYPDPDAYDEPRPNEVDHEKAVMAIACVKVPPADPVYGKNGPVSQLWGAAAHSA